jgi:hypothetical protein
MPEVVSVSGAAPHYTPPRLDGGRPGTFWFNTERPTAGTGWDIDVVAFHEAVPGHHLQLSRLQLLTGLPALQRQRSLAVFSEGWGLYAEQLAEEAGLYTDDRGLLGSVSTSLMRAARLVVDTGIHAKRWTRDQGVKFFVEVNGSNPVEVASEVDRYCSWPGQACGYKVGHSEIVRQRERAKSALGGEGRTVNDGKQSNLIAVEFPATIDAAPEALFGFVHEAVAKLVGESIADNTTAAEQRSGVTVGYTGNGAVRGGALLLQRVAPELVPAYMRFYLATLGQSAPSGDPSAAFAAAFSIPAAILSAINKQIDVVLGGI